MLAFRPAYATILLPTAYRDIEGVRNQFQGTKRHAFSSRQFPYWGPDRNLNVLQQNSG